MSSLKDDLRPHVCVNIESLGAGPVLDWLMAQASGVPVRIGWSKKQRAPLYEGDTHLHVFNPSHNEAVAQPLLQQFGVHGNFVPSTTIAAMRLIALKHFGKTTLVPAVLVSQPVAEPELEQA